MSYRCQECNCQVKSGETQKKVLTQKRHKVYEGGQVGCEIDKNTRVETRIRNACCFKWSSCEEGEFVNIYPVILGQIVQL